MPIAAESFDSPVPQQAGANKATLKSRDAWVDAVIKNMKTLKDEDRPALVLFYGSFSPFHNGHLETLRSCMSATEKRGFKILTSVIHAAPDKWQQRKNADGKEGFVEGTKQPYNTWIDRKTRGELCELAAVNSGDARIVANTFKNWSPSEYDDLARFYLEKFQEILPEHCQGRAKVIFVARGRNYNADFFQKDLASWKIKIAVNHQNKEVNIPTLYRHDTFTFAGADKELCAKNLRNLLRKQGRKEALTEDEKSLLQRVVAPGTIAHLQKKEVVETLLKPFQWWLN